ncbi:phosphatase PAP2 family protein [Mucilaginibacter myungsuensis]|uniref:Phosphatase PAP2 family protein n=1 Tax=Mucilaginibacter myungsuensis TaxID=649104 RepID=A0A929KXU0_9SPHI|nr:phosphatase PAP2 family protein [Mucilaginibacter myungsuensis]MBE9662500.1 phosphatase PAP2 family protein [Mucilaginibacter myungsuensis]MDN3597919.1 phosphatase PAP2 family protein [Mucilaginibacter myungsuensis]
MPEFLLHLDRELFYFFNHTLSNSFFDLVMPYLRKPAFWIPVYAFILIFCISQYKKRGIILILLLIATFALSDFGSASIIKPLVKRVRPCNDPVLATTIVHVESVNCGTGFSFPSSHASNHFAISVFLICVFARLWRWIWLWAILWATSVCLAQMYVGVHYPIDILAGAIYGTIVGYLFGAVLVKKFIPDLY